MKNKALEAFRESIEVKQAFVEQYASMIGEVASMIAAAFNAGGKLIIFGNGGSSTDASHIVAEFVGRFKRERPGLPAISLNTDMAVICLRHQLGPTLQASNIYTLLCNFGVFFST